jgi:hypothetical protein
MAEILKQDTQTDRKGQDLARSWLDSYDADISTRLNIFGSTIKMPVSPDIDPTQPKPGVQNQAKQQRGTVRHDSPTRLSAIQSESELNWTDNG